MRFLKVIRFLRGTRRAILILYNHCYTCFSGQSNRATTVVILGTVSTVLITLVEQLHSHFASLPSVTLAYQKSALNIVTYGVVAPLSNMQTMICIQSDASLLLFIPVSLSQVSLHCIPSKMKQMYHL